jgi:hypothetical protein
MLVNINRAMLRKQIGEWQVRLTNRWRRPGYQEWLGKLESSFFNFVGKGDEPESPGASAHPFGGITSLLCVASLHLRRCEEDEDNIVT